VAEHTIEAIDGSRQGLRVEFFRSADRLAHTISSVSGDQVMPLMRSCEGTDQQIFPPSPPMQQLAIQEVEQRRVAFLVGMAGRSHWSVSIEADGAQRRLSFDVACRMVPNAEGGLASTYEVLQPSAMEVRSGEIHFRHDHHSTVLRPVSVGSSTTPPIGLLPSRIEIRPAHQAEASTTRWAYELVFAS
jgi:hypothetical protein